jgi:hypothetical protein
MLGQQQLKHQQRQKRNKRTTMYDCHSKEQTQSDMTTMFVRPDHIMATVIEAV